MSSVGKVLSIYISSRDVSDPIEKNEILVDLKGITEDKHYGKNTTRSVLITSLDSYILAKENDITMPHAALGENLLIDYNPYSLPVASRLQIGEAVFEITQNCTLCDHLSKIDRKLPKLLKSDRGVFAKVVKSGRVKVADNIFILEASHI